MSLSLYRKKRNFQATPEPIAKEKSSKDVLRFVVQKHDASHLHYDFRLEMRGVLKSWAVPKGPSLNPQDKRLAMMVEDHPYDYREFEGIIPEGNYGAGTVIVWDEGTYEPMDGEGMSKEAMEKTLLKQLHAGDVKLRLKGKKIKGLFALVKIGGEGDEKSWLLIKKKDEYASDTDIIKKDRSVKSGKTLVQIAKQHGKEVNHPEEKGTPQRKKTASKKLSLNKTSTKTAKTSKKAPAKKSAGKKKVPDLKALHAIDTTLLKKTPAPETLVPMLATLVNEPFDNDAWLFEIKWDGYRAVAHVHGKEVELISRNENPFTEKYFPVTQALQRAGLNAVLDGEIVAVDEKGLANFQMLQNWQNTGAKLQFFVFDVMWVDEHDVTALPLVQRKALLKHMLPVDDDVIKFSDHVMGKGQDFFNVAFDQGLEGIMAKKANSVYKPGARSSDWLKVKVNQRQEVVIAGYTQPRNTRKHFGALLLGVYEGNELVYVGHTGSGFNIKSLEAISKKLQPLIIDACPFAKRPKTNNPATWVKPKLVCEIKFSEWTKDGIARHPIFMGLREDKDPKDVRLEKTKTTSSMAKKTVSKKAGPKRAAAPAKKSAAKKSAAKKTATKKTATKKTPEKQVTKTLTASSVAPGGELDLSTGKDQSIILNGQTLALTNLHKPYWKKEGFAKGDMINYYLRMAPYILPYMKDRPQSLHRYPDGVDGQHFYQKDTPDKAPAWLETHTDFSESTGKDVRYLVCSNEATLIYMANQGCIEMHPWHSRTKTWQKPDWSLIDLDPEGIGFDKVIECAQVVKKVLDSIGADCYCKTSGSTGLHIYIPLGAQYDYEQSKQLAELVVNLVHVEIPSYTSVERSPAKRKNKIYLDFLQNRETQTAAAPYSLRPKPGATASAPLHWDEVKKGLTPAQFTIANLHERVRAEGDLFQPVLGKGINLEKVLKNLAALG